MEIAGLRLVRTVITTVITALSFTMPATSAEFEPEREELHGDWRAVLYRNVNGNRLFCAAESYVGTTVFRISHYKDNGETFLELFDPNWNLMEGAVKFSINFTVGNDGYSAEFGGRSWGDAYTHDFTDRSNYTALIGLISKSRTMEVKNSNGATMVTLSGNGSDKAIASYNICVEGDQKAASPNLTFGSFEVQNTFNGKIKLPDFAGRDKAYRDYRTRIREGMSAGPNFAGSYSIVTFGCGTSCLIGVVGDNETGRLFSLPRGGEENSSLQLAFRKNSTLLIAQWADYGTDACVRDFFAWKNETFVQLDTKQIGKQEDCYTPLE